MRLPIWPKALAVTAGFLLSLSCGFLGNTVSQNDATPGAASNSTTDLTSPTSQEGASDVMEELTDPRVEKTLGLRSVQMELQTVFPGETPKRILVSIDAAGNQRIEMTTPMLKESALTPEPPEWNTLEIFVVGGEAYMRMGKTGSAEAEPQQNNALSELLYNPSGPGMWLILLPEESFSDAGKETKGGFDTIIFTVDGSLEGDAVTGEFWVDGQSGALVGANFSLAESIFDPMMKETGGVVRITFSVEKADVPAIILP
jgi:hypothetical protein